MSDKSNWVDLNAVKKPGFAEAYYETEFGIKVGSRRHSVSEDAPLSDEQKRIRIRNRLASVLDEQESVDPDDIDAVLWYRAEVQRLRREEAGFLWNDPSPAGGVLSHDNVVASRTGMRVSDDDWKCRKASSLKVDAHTEIIARKLEEAGVCVRSGKDLVMVGLVTGHEKAVGQYRQIRLLPSVAQSARREMRNALEFYLKAKGWLSGGHDGVRYAVVTAPERVPAFGPLKEVTAELARLISRWASMVREKYGVDVILRHMAVARGVRGDDDFVSYHRHADILYRQTRTLGVSERSEFYREANDFFPGSFHDCGKVRNVSEVVKYAFKSDDIVDASPAELKWLLDEGFGTRQVERMGGFRRFCSQVREDKEKFVRDPDGSGKIIKVQKGKVWRQSEVERDGEPLGARGSVGEGSKEPVARVLTTTCPCPIASPWLEPFVVIQNKGVGLVNEEAHTFEVMKIAARRIWDENGAPDPADALAVAAALTATIGRRKTPAPTEAPGDLTSSVHLGCVTVLGGAKRTTGQSSIPSDWPEIQSGKGPPNRKVAPLDRGISPIRIPIRAVSVAVAGDNPRVLPPRSPPRLPPWLPSRLPPRSGART